MSETYQEDQLRLAEAQIGVIGGDCRTCRRKDYCKKQCTANRKRKEAYQRAMIRMTAKESVRVAANYQRALAAQQAFLRLYRMMGYPMMYYGVIPGKREKDSEDSAPLELLRRCNKLAQNSDKPQYFYIELLIEAIHKKEDDLFAVMNRLCEKYTRT